MMKVGSDEEKTHEGILFANTNLVRSKSPFSVGDRQPGARI